MCEYLDKYRQEAEHKLSAYQALRLNQFRNETKNVGMNLSVDGTLDIKREDFEEIIGKILVKNHGEYSRGVSGPNRLDQFRQDFYSSIKGLVLDPE